MKKTNLFTLRMVFDLRKRSYFNLSYILNHNQLNYGNPDFILKSEKIVIDTKYKVYYADEFNKLREDLKDAVAKDIRQLSGYARDKKLLSLLNIAEESNEVVPCLIIYPNQKGNFIKLQENQLTLECKKAINEFVGFYKIGISLPIIT